MAIQEAEEVRKIREESNFKAQPIRNYKNITGDVPTKILTVPKGPNLATKERAFLKDELDQLR